MCIRDSVMAEHIPHWSYPLAGTVVYLALILALKSAGSSDLFPPMKLTALAVVHNLLLIGLSVAMFAGGVHALWDRHSVEGFDGIFCSQRRQSEVLDGPVGFWVTVYHWSKYYEMLDTVLLSLKRKPTPFIHVYHHSIMVWVSWSWLKFGWLEGSLWCVIANSLIHTFMYSHYLLAALKYKAWWKIYLTSAQLVQFATGTAYVAVYLYNDSIRGAGSGGGCGLWKGGTPRCSRWG
eukprot:TRINITY_DN2075_c0_g1_i9.p1 TRINITY_DN2075_c0_g1~~TRINITY_DN2075_c0_g1_i9.p1  ORF type:complete len:235 (+),score=50.64 TRINITY_DN2075_c0_g1_i9:202-906(+)